MSDLLETVKETIERADRYIRPYAVICQTSNAELLEKAIGNQFKVIGRTEIEKDKCYVIDRKTLEEWAFGDIAELKGENNEKI